MTIGVAEAIRAQLKAKNVADYEIYSKAVEELTITGKSGNFEQIETRLTTDHGLRVIADGRIGLTAMSEDGDPAQLVSDCLETAAYGKEARFRFPSHSYPATPFKPSTYSAQDAVAYLADLCAKLQPDIPLDQLNASASLTSRRVAVANSSGLDARYGKNKHVLSISAALKHSNQRIGRSVLATDTLEFPDQYLDDLKTLYKAQDNRIALPSGRYPVIFSPFALWSLLWRIQEGVSGYSLLYGLTPLKDKLNQAIFPESLTIYDNPGDSLLFDDEGTPTSKKAIIDKGVFRAFLFDLHTAAETGNEPTGNGFKRGFWTESVDTPVTTGFSQLEVAPGETTKQDMFATDGALLVEDIIGAHSGNIVQGQYSMGGSLCYWVEKGEIKGLVDDIMIAGNVYEDFKNISAISKEQYLTDGFTVPYVLFKELSVVGKG